MRSGEPRGARDWAEVGAARRVRRLGRGPRAQRTPLGNPRQVLASNEAGGQCLKDDKDGLAEAVHRSVSAGTRG